MVAILEETGYVALEHPILDRRWATTPSGSRSAPPPSSSGSASGCST